MTVQETARDAAIFADALARQLLGASTPFASKPAQRECMVGAFRAWAALRARMATLERLAPNCCEEGYAEADMLLEIANRAVTARSAA
jgi:hypothetical protein